ncbi:MFS transporter [Phytohabitans houttuyneae]|uniref:MFS transporter n=1 Tax=Phytohabitans houttuyneae TaxID=1076126 RepID=A0A6V8KK10_9ACTN|nr:MFS transporter [Phytohabitans houttuyneae]GFJ85532.1 MFS transporter [Phytohabitans houttuyneae]
MLLYPVYALLFADAGLSTGQISSLFVIWSVVSFTLEIPSGALADAYSRRRLVAIAAVLRAAGFALWTFFPSYPAFAAGFVLWGASSAMTSGSVEALVYDELAAADATDRYVRTVGLAQTTALVAELAAMALATPAFLLGGYTLVGVASVAVSLAAVPIALSFPEAPRAEETGGGSYLKTLRAGLAEVRANRTVSRAVVLYAAVTGLGAIDEYVPILARDMGAPTSLVPLLFVLPVAAMAVASALAERWAHLSAARLAAAVAVGGVLLAAGANAGSPAGMVAVALCFAVLELFDILTEARIQDAITGPARATVLSVAGFGQEVAALAVYAGFGLGSAVLPVPVMLALVGVPLVLSGLVTRRWLPPARSSS